MAKSIGASVEFWTGLQADYDTARARISGASGVLLR